MINVRYNLIDTATNTVLENITADDIAKILGVSKHYVTSSARKDNLIQFRYKVEYVETLEVANKHIPNDLWAEWERIRKPLNIAIKKRGKDIQIISLG